MKRLVRDLNKSNTQLTLEKCVFKVSKTYFSFQTPHPRICHTFYFVIQTSSIHITPHECVVTNTQNTRKVCLLPKFTDS